MLTAIFAILMIAVFGKMLVLALKAAWGISKILVTLVFLPIALIVMVVVGLIKLAIPILIVLGIISVLRSIAAK